MSVRVVFVEPGDEHADPVARDAREDVVAVITALATVFETPCDAQRLTRALAGALVTVVNMCPPEQAMYLFAVCSATIGQTREVYLARLGKAAAAASVVAVPPSKEPS